MKRNLVYALSIPAALLIIALFLWAFFQHGTDGFLQVTNLALYAFILVGGLDLLLIILTFLYSRLSRRPARRGLGLFAISLSAVSAVLILVFAGLWLLLAGVPSAGISQHVPQKPIDSAVSQPFHFAVGSDAHFGAGTNDLTATRAMLARIADPTNRYDLFLYLGDLVEYGFLDSQWKEALEALSPVAAQVPLRFAAGNHDTLFAGFGRYLQYCAPSASPNPGDTKLWYRLDAGNLHFLLLDVEWSAESYGAAQAAWLEAQLASIPEADWKIVLSHGFYYASGIDYHGWQWYDNPETIARITPLFEKYRVDLVFSGHDHNLEWLQHNGVRYAVVGGFGGQPDPVRTYNSPASLWYQGGSHGFADVKIDGDQAKLVFRGPQGQTLQELSFQKGS